MRLAPMGFRVKGLGGVTYIGVTYNRQPPTNLKTKASYS